MFGKLFKGKIAQDVCLLTEMNSVEDRQLDSLILHAESNGTAEAWGLDSEQQCKDEKTGRYVQLISSVSCEPVTIYRGADGKKAARGTNTSTISAETEDKEMTYTGQGKSGNGIAIWLTACVTMIVFVVLLVGYLRLVRG
jgi:hypothetical protein